MNPASNDYGSASRMDEAMKQRALEELRLRQRRIGTVDELPEDYHRVCDLAHLLSNRLTVEALTASLSRQALKAVTKVGLRAV